MMNNKVKTIIRKVRNIYKHDPDKKDIVARKAYVNFRETEDGEVELSSIEFNWYGGIYVYKNKIVYNPVCGDRKVILEYKDWDELINL